MRPEVIPPNARLRDAVAAIEGGRKTIAVMTDASGKLLGTISDGDIRRAILKGAALDASASELVNRVPVTAREDTDDEDLIALLDERGIEALPILDRGGRFVRTVMRSEMLKIQGLPNSADAYWSAVVMAGGEGKRLRPHTQHMPKPMLAVGGMPLLERNIRALAAVGVQRFFLSVNYLAHVIENHFGDGSHLGVRIEYLRETEPLGTGGALRLIGEQPAAPLLVMNGDLLSGLNVGRMLAFHNENDAAITVAATEYVIEIPFGVLHTSGTGIVRLSEKPSERYLCNAGIYTLSPQVLSALPEPRRFDMTTLIEHILARGGRVAAFPMYELWKDIGTPDQLEEARKLVEPGEIS
jgi:dTDP-glucose pyrophosphorylase